MGCSMQRGYCPSDGAIGVNKTKALRAPILREMMKAQDSEKHRKKVPDVFYQVFRRLTKRLLDDKTGISLQKAITHTGTNETRARTPTNTHVAPQN